MKDHEALMIASKAHALQRDKGGKPYIGHPIRVANRCLTVDEKVAALLHDVVEDGHLSLDQLREMGATEAQIRAIDALTRRAGETYREFIERVRLDPIGRVVKLADIADNTDPERVAQLPEHERGIVRRYEKARARLLAP
jgi:(p)ppGpp synthase/HD superfamily hydrolase